MQLGNVALAQPDLKKEFVTTIKQNKPSLLLRLETRNSFITHLGVQIWGIKLGANFGQNLNVGIGYHFLNPKSHMRLDEALSLANGSTMRLEYIAPFIEYRFYNRGRYSVAIPLQLGLGTVYTRNVLSGSYSTGLIVLYEAMLTGEVKCFTYLGLGAGLGYRLALANTNLLNLKLNSPLYNVRFNVYFQELYRDLKK